MIRSLYSGVSGLKNHQIRMDVVGNNISNVNTTGYKAGAANFQDALSQTIRSGGNGRNPSQIGTGMSVGSIYNDFTQGPTQSTGRSLDLAINGNGFLVVKDVQTDAEYYTRAGALFLDNEGYLVNSDGLRIQSSVGDIRVFNGPVATISIGPNGSITGTNTNGEPLQFTSTPITIPAPTSVTEAQLIGGSIGELYPVASATGSFSGDAIVPATAPVEAKVTGNGNGVAPIGITVPFDMTGYQLTLEYGDGTGTPVDFDTTIDTIDLTGINSWGSLAAKLENAINTKIQGELSLDPTDKRVRVSYNSEPYGGLVFETITNPDQLNSGGTNPITPSLTIGGADVAWYMGDSIETKPGSAVVAQNWTGRAFRIDTGSGWTDVVLKADYSDWGYADLTNFNNVTSGKDLAQKIQALLNVMAGDDPTTAGTLEGEANVTVTWDTDHLVFSPNPADPGKTVTLGGTDIADFIGTGSAATSSNIDWTSKDITINYNGTVYSFSLSEKQAAGLGSITNGDALAAALNNLIDNKIGSDKVDFTWSVDHLVINTKDTAGIGNRPSIVIGGTNAADFVGGTTSAYGIASTQPEIPGQEPDNVIRLVTFSNPEGLIKVGTNIYESNAATSGLPVNDTESTIDSGYVEMSNVDLTDEFSNMIVTQRGYQANSRIITVSDTMLEELLNLKR